MFGRMRFGVDPAEVGVAFLVDLVDSDPAAGEQARQPAAAGPPHRVDQDRHVGPLQRVEVDRPADEPLVTLERVVALDQAGGLGVGERPPGDADPAVDRESRLDDRQDLGPGRGSGRGLDLEAVVHPRVVAGGDDDPGCRSPFDHLVRGHLGRHGVDREGDTDVVSEQDLGRGHREVFGREAPVIGDDDALGRLPAACHVRGDAIGAAPDIVVGELVGDARAPAIGPEDDRRGRRRCAGQGHVNPPVRSSARADPRRWPGRGRCRAGSRWAWWPSSYRARVAR